MTTTRRQAEYLASRGDRVTVVSADHPEGWKGVDHLYAPHIDGHLWLALEYLAEGISHRILRRWPRWSLSGFFDKYRFPHSAARVIADAQSTWSFDGFVCSQHFCAMGLAVRGLPFVLVAHGDIFEHPPSAFTAAVEAFYRRAALVSYRAACHVVTVSRSLRSRAIACGAEDNCVTVIPNGIGKEDLSERGGAWLGSGTGERVADLELLFVGRLAAEKAVDIALRAVSQLPRAAYRLRIVGNGPELGRLVDLAQELGISDYLQFLGYQPRHALLHYYDTADIVLLPSLTEAHPLTLLECQLLGVPAIASCVGGVRDVITHGWNGLLVSPGNVQELSDAIFALWRNPTLRLEMSLHARQNATDFSWANLLETFRKVLHLSFDKI